MWRLKSTLRATRAGLLCALLGAALATGCGTTRPPLTDVELRERRAELVHLINEDYQHGLREMLARMELESDRATTSRDARYDVLILHGAGPAGAFAAGFLTGWAEVGDPAAARPAFDYVTGSSSGALLAPFAFSGRDADYTRILELFCTFPANIFHSPNLFALWPTRSALLDARPLARLIEQEISPDMVEQLARGSDERRTLLVATTDLDLGLGRAWDLGLEARKAGEVGDDQRIHDILRASTALPIVFPPVEIDGSLHADGGVASSLFLGFGLHGIEAISELWKTTHPNRAMPEIHVWLIINQQLFSKTQNTRPRYLDIAARSVDIMMEYDRFKATLYTAGLIEEIDELEGVTARFHWVSIPADAKLPQQVDTFDDIETIRELTELGAHMGASRGSWNHDMPAFDEVLPEKVDAHDPKEPAGSRTYCPAPQK